MSDSSGAVDPVGKEDDDQVEDEKTRVARPPHGAQPLIPSVAPDDRDVGWGDDGTDRDDQWYQRERPPHWS